MKAIKLKLSESMQWDNACIQSKAIRDKWRIFRYGRVEGARVLQPGRDHIAVALTDACMAHNRPQLKKDIPGLVEVWVAQRIEGKGNAKIARRIGLMTGKKRDEAAVGRSLKTLERWLSKSRFRPMSTSSTGTTK